MKLLWFLFAVCIFVVIAVAAQTGIQTYNMNLCIDAGKSWINKQGDIYECR